ncbi:MAG: BamA/TamA family outer membrane protein [Candidatus Kapaibacterium sp.]
MFTFFRFSWFIITLLSATYLLHAELPADTIPKSRSGITGFPYISYTAETKLAGGVGGLYYFRLDTIAGTRPSNITASTEYSQRKQFSIGIYPEFYLDGESKVITSTFKYSKYPAYLFGRGSRTTVLDKESYTPEGCKIIINFLANLHAHSIRNGWNIGGQFDFRFDSIQQSDSMASGNQGLIESHKIIGSSGGIVSGLGVVVNFDTRDNLFSARAGSYFDTKLSVYGGALGSEYSYRKLYVDFRQYFPGFTDDDAFTYQAIASFVSEGAPFYKLSDVGGEYMLRGYFNSRFRDNNALAVQGEYRSPLWWRFGAVGFLGLGDVFGRLSDLSLRSIKLTGGTGIRFVILPDERANLRFDVGFSNEEMQLYLGFFEAW